MTAHQDKDLTSFEKHISEALAAENVKEADIHTVLDILAKCCITSMPVFLATSAEELSSEILQPNEDQLPFGLRKALKMIHEASLACNAPTIPAV